MYVLNLDSVTRHKYLLKFVFYFLFYNNDCSNLCPVQVLNLQFITFLYYYNLFWQIILGVWKVFQAMAAELKK